MILICVVACKVVSSVWYRIARWLGWELVLLHLGLDSGVCVCVFFSSGCWSFFFVLQLLCIYIVCRSNKKKKW